MSVKISGEGSWPIAPPLVAGLLRISIPDPVHTRGEHGQDQDWISCRLLSIFLHQDWIWMLIFEKKWIRTGSGYWFDSITKFSWEWFKMSQMMVAVFPLLWSLYCQYVLHSSQSMVIRVTLSLIFSGQVEVVSCSYIAGMLFCLLRWMAYVCVV